MSCFWDNFDKEEGASAASVTSLEFGKSMGVPFNQAPKLRKHCSTIHPPQCLFNLSTSSVQKKLRMKPRSTGALRFSKPAEPILNLPNGIHQLRSGIGFTYNMPTVIYSKRSISSFAPANSMIQRKASVKDTLALRVINLKLTTKAINIYQICKPVAFLFVYTFLRYLCWGQFMTRIMHKSTYVSESGRRRGYLHHILCIV